MIISKINDLDELVRLVGHDSKAADHLSKISWDRMSSFSIYDARQQKVVLVLGLVSLWAGVAEVYWIQAVDSELLFTKTIYQAINLLLNACLSEFHRLQCCVHEDHSGGRKLAIFFGFQQEGILRQYSWDKRNFVMYSLCPSQLQ